jgi:hypothetical protein
MDDLDQFANRASAVYMNEPGYQGTRVHSYSPPILEHSFDSYINAENFASRLQLQGSKSRFRISGATVLEHRPP